MIDKMSPFSDKLVFIMNENGFKTADLSVKNAEDVTAYYKARSDRSVDTDKWFEIVEGIKFTKYNIVNFKKWLNAQTKGEYLYGKRLDFLLDVIAYIATGRRKVTPNNWLDLLMAEQVQPDKRRVIEEGAESKINKQLTLLESTSLTDVIPSWCKHHNGFDDMICVTNILFGKYRPTSEPVEVKKVTTSNMFT